jgi:hypothetical protein
MSSRNKDERAHVNALIKAIQKNSPRCYVYIDRDAGDVRHTSSGWDFLLALDGRVVFCEAKQGNRKLSEWQALTQAFVKRASCEYHVVKFRANGIEFIIDDDKLIETEEATFDDFI